MGSATVPVPHGDSPPQAIPEQLSLPTFSFSKSGQGATVRIMSAVANPALEAFLAFIQEEQGWGQIIVRRVESGYEMLHLSDRLRSAKELQLVPLSEVRRLAQFTSAGGFRPLKSAPDLPSGWRIEVRDATELGLAVNQLYPGSIADWFAAQSLTPPVTNYRDFTNRQTGMYRITTKLSDEQAAQVIQACCHESLCLKRRLWSIAGLQSDVSAHKSAIPCLEPCAIMLEFARKAMRLEQEEKANLALGSSELKALAGALEKALSHHDAALTTGDLEAPTNPRRVRLLLEKIRATLPSNVKCDTE